MLDLEYQQAARHSRLWLKSEQLGVAGNTQLAEYVEKLEDKIRELELCTERLIDRVYLLENK